MSQLVVHCIVIYRSKKNPSRYRTSRHTLSGENISERIDSMITLETSSWSDRWELVNFSHAFLPFDATGGGQI